MHLISGKTFNVHDYSANDFEIRDIAYALSMQCRWGGHTETWFSVAEHSVRVAELCMLNKDYALLHDASEYIFPDLPTPLKIVVPQYKAESDRLQEVINRYFGLTGPEPPIVKSMDLLIKDWEWRVYVKNKREAWSQEDARRRFIDMAVSLFPGRL